ncbi:MAG: hypothetical protein KatS3mg107_0334 [Gemmataceae bacterium]|nr:MAG: hypothetical protein KatS3mg107_0334 [Gemmataceae bacterium]
MAKKKSGETNLPLIIALVFFVLTTIAFGVLWYMQYSDHQAKEEAIKKAASERAAAQGLAAEAEMKAKVYRCYLGIADEKDRTDIGAETKGKDKISAELRRINEELAKAGGYLAGPPPPGLIIWNPDNPTEPPARGLIQSYADARQKLQAAEKTSRDAIQDFRGAVAALKAAADELQKYSLDFKKQADDFPKQLNAKIQEVIKRYDDRIRIYASEEEKARKEIDSQAEQIAKLDREKKLIEQKTQRLEQEVELLMDKMAQKRDVFEYDQPLGTILRRLPNNLVEINLGFRDLVRPGLTFVVLPDDFPQKGRQSRLRRIRVPDERGIYQDQVRFVPAGVSKSSRCLARVYPERVSPRSRNPSATVLHPVTCSTTPSGAAGLLITSLSSVSSTSTPMGAMTSKPWSGNSRAWAFLWMPTTTCGNVNGWGN